MRLWRGEDERPEGEIVVVVIAIGPCRDNEDACGDEEVIGGGLRERLELGKSDWTCGRTVCIEGATGSSSISPLETGTSLCINCNACASVTEDWSLRSILLPTTTQQ